ncbi:MAG: TldD/PmbA family protein [Clostridiaceae bacterium]|nr:TldD/PmbA family protein [Clostridiaceae bacterium]
MNFLENYKRAINNLPEHITEAEVNAEQKISVLIGVSCGQIVKTDVSDVTSVYVRASGDKTGYAYTEDLSEDPNKVILKAYNNGIVSDSYKRDILNSPETAYNSLNAAKCAGTANIINFSDIVAKAMLLENLVRSAVPSINTAFANIRVDTFSSRVINSKGVDVYFTRNVVYAQVKVTAEILGDSVDAACSVSASSIEEIDPDSLVSQINNILRNKIKPGNFQPGEYPVILSHNVGVNIMMTAWQLFSGIKYFDGSTVLKGRLGEYIGSSALSIIDTPFHSGTGYCFPFDCEGTPGKETILVDKGKFTGLMHNLSSSSHLNAQPSGNAGRVALLTGNVPTDVIVTPKICFIQPGVRSVEEMLKDMGDGVYITESYDIFHSINIGSGDFAIPCRGIVIKDGKPHHSVTALTICGNLINLFNNIEETGNDLLIDEFLLRSYCVGSPSIRLSKLQVNGK